MAVDKFAKRYGLSQAHKWYELAAERRIFNVIEYPNVSNGNQQVK